jgi:uncharacterized BrkB/YihY/UPF0761 family membrane protein
MKFQDFKYLITQSFQEWSEDKASRLAAALAYYTVFSIPPLLIIVLAITGQVFDDAQARITAEITSLMSLYVINFEYSGDFFVTEINQMLCSYITGLHIVFNNIGVVQITITAMDEKDWDS